jgi:uncharacterized protein (DUF2147 family)
MKSFIIGIFSVLLFVSAPTAKPITGDWKTIDDETGKAKSVVRLYKKSNGKLYGKIIKLYRAKGEDPDPICDKCEGSKKNKKIIGMEIVTGLKKDGNEWYADNGILDPSKGTVYDCKMWLDSEDNNKLNVRGYVGWFYRTQTWHRIK